MSMSTEIHCEICHKDGDQWWHVAEFDIGSAAALQHALQGVGLADRGLPNDLCKHTSITHELHNDVSKIEPNPAEKPFGKTWLTIEELPLLFEAKHWLSERYLETYRLTPTLNMLKLKQFRHGWLLQKPTKKMAFQYGLLCGSCCDCGNKLIPFISIFGYFVNHEKSSDIYDFTWETEWRYPAVLGIFQLRTTIYL